MSKNQRSTSQTKGRFSRKKKWILAIIVPLVLLFAGGAAYAVKLFQTTEEVLDASYKEIIRTEPVEKVDPIEDPVSFLFLGIDNDNIRDLGSTRADSIIYATVNPKTHEMDMLSIPRDTFVPIMQNGKEVRTDRINAAYAIGEEDTMVETVESFLGLPVNYYATLNFHSFLDVIDALGGVEVDVPVDMTEMDSNDRGGAITLKKGKQVLDGEQTLALARTRKIDDDIKRGSRQQLIVKSIIQKATGVESVTKYNDVLKKIGKNMRTNMKMDEVKSVLQTGLNDNFKIESHVFEWSSFMDSGRDLVRIMPDSFNEIRASLIESLELKETSSRMYSDTTETTTNSSSNIESDDDLHKENDLQDQYPLENDLVETDDTVNYE